VFTLYEVAEKLRVSYRTVINYVNSGRIKAVKVGRRWLVTAEEMKRVEKEGA
jgi:excisionase family DNA binding protein